MQNTVPVAHWYWKDEHNKWFPYDPANNAAIEAGFISQMRDALIIGGKYVVNFATRKQVNLQSGYTREVRRGTWFWIENGNTAYIPYPEHIAAALETSWKSGHFNTFQIDVGDHRYVVLRPDGSSRQYRRDNRINKLGRAVMRGYNNQCVSSTTQITQIVQQAPVQTTQVVQQVQQMPQTVVQTTQQMPQAVVQTTYPQQIQQVQQVQQVQQIQQQMPQTVQVSTPGYPQQVQQQTIQQVQQGYPQQVQQQVQQVQTGMYAQQQQAYVQQGQPTTQAAVAYQQSGNIYDTSGNYSSSMIATNYQAAQMPQYVGQQQQQQVVSGYPQTDA